jgi:hypothetical protein
MYGKSSRIVGKGGDALRITASNYTLSHQRSRSVIFLGKVSSVFWKIFWKKNILSHLRLYFKIFKIFFLKELPQLQLPTTWKYVEDFSTFKFWILPIFAKYPHVWFPVEQCHKIENKHWCHSFYKIDDISKHWEKTPIISTKTRK